MARAQAFVFDAYGTLFDVHSVVTALQAVTPEAEAVSRQWRAKQLEYTWLRSLMGCYVDFWTVTDEALRFALKCFAIGVTAAQHTALLKAYLQLSAYPEIPGMLAALAPRPCLILSNGTRRMLEAVVESNGLAGKFSHILSADQVRVYKPDPRVYALVPEALGLAKEAVAFVSTNAFDVIGGESLWLSSGMGESHAGSGRRIGGRAKAEAFE